MSIYDKAADELWRLTLCDWHVSVNLILTEPVCAVVTLTPDYEDMWPSFSGFLGTHDLNKSCQLAIEHALVTIREVAANRSAVPHLVPRNAAD